MEVKVRLWYLKKGRKSVRGECKRKRVSLLGVDFVVL